MYRIVCEKNYPIHNVVLFQAIIEKKKKISFDTHETPKKLTPKKLKFVSQICAFIFKNVLMKTLKAIYIS